MKVSKKHLLSLLMAMTMILSTIFLSGCSKNTEPFERKLNVYYINWASTNAIHQNQSVEDLPWDRISTINHAFWKISPNETHTEFPIVSADPYADENCFAQYRTMSEQYPDVDIVLSIGGWGDTKWFTDMASKESGRESFINSCIETMETETFLDGIDIDWEYPGTTRNHEGEGYIGSADDKENFSALLKEMRSMFDAAGFEDKIITYCASTNTGLLKDGSIAVDFKETADYVDRINIMTYDTATSGTMQGMHHSALYPGQYVHAGSSASEAAEYLINLGVDSRKINIGSPLYSQGWFIGSSITEGTDTEIAAGALGQTAHAPGFGSIGAGQVYWFDLKAMEHADGWIAGYDEISAAAYLFNNDPTSILYNQFYTYESEQSLQAKLEYIEEKDLGGLIVWSTPGDGSGFPMLSQMAEGLGIWEGEIPVFAPDPFTPPEHPKANPIGYWRDDIQWNIGDVAINEGIVALCIAQTTVPGGEPPTEETGWGWGRWQYLCEEADLFDSADSLGISIPEFDREVRYNAGAIVTCEGAYYRALLDTHGEPGGWGEAPIDPDFGWGYWEPYNM